MATKVISKSDCPQCHKTTTIQIPNDGEIWRGVCNECGAKIKIDKSDIQVQTQQPSTTPTKSKPEYAPAPIHITARMRCLVCRDTATDVPIVLGRADVLMSEKFFFKQVRNQWHGFYIQPERAFLIASIGKWWGIRSEQVQYLMYDIDEGTGMWYVDKKGKKGWRIMHDAKEMAGIFMPSIELGLWKKQEAILSAYKARQQQVKQQSTTSSAILAIVAVACLIVGIFIGYSMRGVPATVPAIPTNSTKTIIQTLLLMVRNLI